MVAPRGLDAGSATVWVQLPANPFCVVWSFNQKLPPFRASRRSVEAALDAARRHQSAPQSSLGMLNQQQLLVLLDAMCAAQKAQQRAFVRSTD